MPFVDEEKFFLFFFLLKAMSSVLAAAERSEGDILLVNRVFICSY